ncbi:shikimate kinase [Paramicrobacterium agarici]|uniref:Shikimate kinase n=1 Tax=Paramicrobacterium agarici TaxID=630514 RepID=A0A2A9DZF3_9MICO|nr:shikimate kinase [Microbacterium agarici]
MVVKQLPLVFIGPMGSGKTRIGRRVAKALGERFIDTDKSIVTEHGPISAIFEEHGEEYFRGLERRAVAEALTAKAVISLGGGAVVDVETQRLLEGHTVIELTVTAEAVLARMDTSKRPLLKNGPEAWERIYDERRAVYARLATATFDTSSGPISRIADDIVAWVRN